MSGEAGKICLITGGAQGLGRAFSEALLRNGAMVCLTDINTVQGEATVNELSRTYGKERVMFVKCDVTSQQNMEDAFRQTKSIFGGLDIVCNNAGIVDESNWEKTIQIDLVCLTDIDTVQGETTAKELSRTYGKERAMFVKCDATSQQDMEDAFRHTKSIFGGLDIVCNNAGISDESNWEKTIQINLTSVIRGTMLGIEYMSKENGGAGGTILNIASEAGLKTVHHSPSYSAAKHGVVAFTRSWAKNPACNSMGLRFHALCPAFAQTAILAPKEGKVIDGANAKKLVELFGIMSPETVANAFMELLQREDSSGEVLSVSQTKGTKWEKEGE